MKWILFSGGAVAAIVIAVVVIGMLLPRAHTARRSVRLKYSADAVWGLIAGDQSWRPELRKYESVSSATGQRVWKETDKHGQTITYEAVESVAPRRMVARIADPNLPFGGTWTYEIQPDAGGCTVTITENGEVYNPIFRFVSRFVIGHTATIDAYLKALQTKLDEGGQADGARA
ncbi:MAG TPA: SRPBCC family protein [Bryobacteraceae bacterium]|nr:SRPBCC family protein [Bryobacteraceae bacterium]